AGAKLLLTQEHLRGIFPNDSGTKSIALDSAWSAIARESPGSASRKVCADDLAYVISTSGSTGRPKATAIRHRSVGNVLGWIQENYPLTGEDAIVQRIPFAFDGSVCDFYWPFLAGARLILLRPDAHRDPDYLARVVEEHRATTIILVPSMLS